MYFSTSNTVVQNLPNMIPNTLVRRKYPVLNKQLRFENDKNVVIAT